jgi:hypothetical protein
VNRSQRALQPRFLAASRGPDGPKAAGISGRAASVWVARAGRLRARRCSPPRNHRLPCRAASRYPVRSRRGTRRRAPSCRRQSTLRPPAPRSKRSRHRRCTTRCRTCRHIARSRTLRRSYSGRANLSVRLSSPSGLLRPSLSPPPPQPPLPRYSSHRSRTTRVSSSLRRTAPARSTRRSRR